jgi:very-short-patch-repair endonuclease
VSWSVVLQRQSGVVRRPGFGYRDIELFEAPVSHQNVRGRDYIAVVGIDRYRAWSPLHNAVRDARGALNAFVKLGFLPFCEPILNQAATGQALRTLVTDRLRGLDRNDSLVLFFAGHGHTLPPAFSDDNGGRRGYLIPVDAEGVEGSIGTWLQLDAWLSEITHLPARHILVILDACHSGIALDPATRWRSDGPRFAEPMETLRARRSRRILTSALDDEVAMDGGPISGHSLFTGCLIEALTGGLFASLQRPVASASELWSHVRQRVFAFSSVKNWKQTPEFGRLDFDDHGELVVELPAATVARPEPAKPAVVRAKRARPARTPKTPVTAAMPAATQPTTVRKAGQGAATRTAATPPIAGVPRAKHPAGAPHRRAVRRRSAVELAPPAPTAIRAALDSARRAPPTPAGAAATPDRARPTLPASPERHAPAADLPAQDAVVMAALDRHEAERLRGACVLSTLAGDPGATATSWAAWAARRGYLTLVTECATLEAVIEDLLAQVPWLRSIPAARDRLAAAARLPAAEVDAALDARLDAERATWIDEVAALDRHAQVSGWLLSALRQPRARIPDPMTAPVQGPALLSILCDLAAPIAVLLHRAEPDARWLEAAIRTAAALVTHMPRHSIAVAAPSAQIAEVLRGWDSAALSMARQGVVPIAVRGRAPLEDRARSRAEVALHEALARDPRTAGHFALNVVVSVGERNTVEVDLLAMTARLAVEIDGWYHFRDPHGYRRDRAKDVLLQRAGFFVLRFLAEDVHDRLALIVDEVAISFGGRRAASHLQENTP